MKNQNLPALCEVHPASDDSKNERKPRGDLNLFLREQMNALANATDQAAANSQMQAWLRLMMTRHPYSVRNMLLVMFQDVEATHVGSATYWASLGRFLKPDAPKIWVQAPAGRTKSSAKRTANNCTRPVSETVEALQPSHDDVREDLAAPTQSSGLSRVFFVDVPIYDVRHTEGAALPQIPEWRSLARDAELDEHLRAFAATHNIIVKELALGDGSQGMSLGGLITLDPNAGVKTFVHELIHELLPHRDSWLPAAVREWQAEIGAYLVCTRLGVPDLNCPMYLASWTASGKQVRKQFEIAAKPAHQIITFVEARLGLSAGVTDAVRDVAGDGDEA